MIGVFTRKKTQNHKESHIKMKVSRVELYYHVSRDS